MWSRPRRNRNDAQEDEERSAEAAETEEGEEGGEGGNRQQQPPRVGCSEKRSPLSASKNSGNEEEGFRSVPPQPLCDEAESL